MMRRIWLVLLFCSACSRCEDPPIVRDPPTEVPDNVVLIQLIDAADGQPIADQPVELMAQPRERMIPRKAFEGVSDADGLVTISRASFLAINTLKVDGYKLVRVESDMRRVELFRNP